MAFFVWRKKRLKKAAQHRIDGEIIWLSFLLLYFFPVIFSMSARSFSRILAKLSVRYRISWSVIFRIGCSTKLGVPGTHPPLQSHLPPKYVGTFSGDKCDLKNGHCAVSAPGRHSPPHFFTFSSVRFGKNKRTTAKIQLNQLAKIFQNNFGTIICTIPRCVHHHIAANIIINNTQLTGTKISYDAFQTQIRTTKKRIFFSFFTINCG